MRPRVFALVTLAIDIATGSLAVLLTELWVETTALSNDGLYGLWLFPLFTAVALWSRGLYRPHLRMAFLDDLGLLAGGISMAAMSLLLVLLFTDVHPQPGALTARIWLLALILLALGRLGRTLLYRRARTVGGALLPTLIVGAGLVANNVARRLIDQPSYGLRPVGFLEDQANSPRHGGVKPFAPDKPLLPLLGSPAELGQIAAETGARHVIVAFSSASDRQLLDVARACHMLDLEIAVVPRLFDAVSRRITVEHVGGLPLLYLRRLDLRGWQFTAKHVVDRIGAALGLIALAPLFLVLAIAVRLDSSGPVFFRQPRIGRDGQVFDLLKFRSMAVGDEAAGNRYRPRPGFAPGGVEGLDRRTRVGAFLRRTSLDELPQFINVIRGEMSLVGPRPERPDFVELFQQEIERYGERHRVKAGITGWAQVNGLRGKTSIADRAEWDNYYIENWSVALDLKILALTFLTVFRRSED